MKNKRLSKLEIMCWIYDDKIYEDKKIYKNKILYFCLEELDSNSDTLEMINEILDKEEGGYKLIVILYEILGLEFKDVDYDGMDFDDE